jgi:hypothetical protein
MCLSPLHTSGTLRNQEGLMLQHDIIPNISADLPNTVNGCYQAELAIQVLHAIMTTLDTTTKQSVQVIDISQLSPTQQATGRLVPTTMTLDT